MSSPWETPIADAGVEASQTPEIDRGKAEHAAMNAEAAELKARVITDIMNVEDPEMKEHIARQHAEELQTTHEELLRLAAEAEDRVGN